MINVIYIFNRCLTHKICDTSVSFAHVWTIIDNIFQKLLY